MIKNSSDILIELSKNSKDKEVVYDNALSISHTNPYSLCDFAEYVPLVDEREIMEVLENGIINFDDIDHIYEFMFLMVDLGIKNFNLPRFEKLIRDSKNPKLMVYSLAFVPGINEDSMLNSLYATRSVKYLEKLKSEEYGLDVNKLSGYRQALNIAKRNVYFPATLLKFGTRNTSELIERVVNSKDLYLINELADYLEYLKTYLGFGYDMKKLEKTYLDLAKDEPLHLYEYASSIASSDKDKFTFKVIDKRMAKYMYYMYEYVEGVNRELLRSAIAGTKNEKYIKRIKMV